MLTMLRRKQATIKGVFVNSHLSVLRRRKGEEALRELERRFGAPLRFGALQEVPVCEEVLLIELVLDLLEEGHGLQGAARAEAAGALHFKNFTQTTLGATLLNSLPHTREGFHTLIRNAGSIARAVFNHSDFSARRGRDNIIITIQNCDYAPEHFQGFFGEWMRYWGLADSSVRVYVLGNHAFEYRLYF